MLARIWSWTWVGCVVLLLAGVVPGYAQEKATGPLGSIERLKPGLDRLIPPGAQMEKLATGFDWIEGPLWVPEQKALLFSDVPLNTVFRWKEGEGVSVFLKPSGYTGASPRGGEPGSNGLTLDAKGGLVLMQHGDRRIARLKTGGGFETLADRHDGKRFNSPNDGVHKTNGDLYFTDPPYGLLKLNDDPGKELPYNGVYRLDRTGKVTLLTRELSLPNGLAFSPDEKTLYVANSDPKKAIWMAYPVRDDGTLGDGRVFFDVTAMVAADRPGLPDGLKVDQHGNIFATGPGGIWIFAPDGTQLGLLKTGVATGNCAWGDDGSTLYIAADMFLARLRTTTRGTGR